MKNRKQIKRKLKRWVETAIKKLSYWSLYLTLATAVGTIMTLGIATLTVIPLVVPILYVMLSCIGLLLLMRLFLSD